MSEILTVLLGDVEDSRRIEDREGLGARLESVCAELNERLRRDLRARFRILKGVDEVGAVLESFSSAYEMISEFSSALHPARMRFALARGEVDTAVDGGDISRMDGPVFHKAAELMTELKSAKLMFAMSVGDEAMDCAVSASVNMLLLFKGRMTERQWGAVTEYERTGSQAEAGEVLGVSQQAISHALVTSDYRQVKLVEERVNRAFADYARRAAEAGGRNE